MIARRSLSLPILLVALIALGLAVPLRAQNCTHTSTGLVPLDQLGTGTYQGSQGGFYPNGSNVRPEAHTIDGLAQATAIVPRDASGAPAANGKIGFLSIGMSNATFEFQHFVADANADALKSPRVVVVDGAQGGQTAAIIQDPNANFWTVVEQRLANAGVSDAQVQAIWFKEADAGPTNGWPAYAQTLLGEFKTCMNVLRTKFPNARVCYVASRIYAGYATTTLNPEPYSYQQGFTCKWLIEAQINGDPALGFDPARGPVVSPWIDWGTYNWADGLTPGSDGLTWACSDFVNDGTHPSDTGREKVAQRLLAFVHTDPIAASWYLAHPGPAPFGTGKLTSISTLPAMVWAGMPSLSANNFSVGVQHGIPGGVGIVFHGALLAEIPFVNATRYVANPLVRLAVHPFNGSGLATWSVPIDASMVGTTRFYQGYLRDVAQPDGTGADVSNALRVVFWN